MEPHSSGRSQRPRRVFLLGATGTIGRATVAALLERGHEVVCFVRSQSDTSQIPAGAIVRTGNLLDAGSLRRDGFCIESFDAVVSCIASRTGAPDDCWAVDYQINLDALAAAKDANVSHMVLLSAICVQKPRLAFQRAKLAFERDLIDSGMTYSIVRPTAFFKSVAGQIERVKQGKSFLVFGDGRLTACKPISDADVARYLADCLEDPALQNKILPVGGPGPAVTPRDQGDYLFNRLGRPAKFASVPVGLLTAIIHVLSALSWIIPPLKAKAEFARIGKYYATESMLVLDPETGCYDADATPSCGTETLFDYYDTVLKGEAAVERGDHTVFERGETTR